MRVSVAQLLGLCLLAVVGYVALKYLPVASHYLTMGEIARTTSAAMVLNFDDGALTKSAVEKAKAAGVTIEAKQVKLTRGRDAGSLTCTLRWTERIQLVGGRTHVFPLEVSETTRPQKEALMRNAP